MKFNTKVIHAGVEAEDKPLPNDETTPPVTNIYRAMEVLYSCS